MIVRKGNKNKHKLPISGNKKPSKTKSDQIMAANQVFGGELPLLSNGQQQQQMMSSSQQMMPPRMDNGEENDEENIVIDMPDEDDDEDDDDEADNDVAGHGRDDANNNSDAANQYQTLHAKQSSEYQIDESRHNDNGLSSATYNAGDLIWFDPNQLGYSIPGKVLDFYPDLTVLTVEGCGQPIALEDTQLEDEARNRLLLKADDSLQVYELSDSQLFKLIKRRQPITSTTGLSDLVDLDEMSMESIIWNLKLRQKHDLIYTRCGEKILISLNPYKQLFDIYNLDQVNKYDTITSAAANLPANQQHHQVSASSLLKWLLINQQQLKASEPERPSHIFKMANEALKSLLINQQDQCFVLLGDSGSGKTEACKLLVQYFATVNKSPTNLMTEQILEAIQVLESFGNAKTILNDNSSRFGKLLEIKFNLSNGYILNAKLIDLNLLDRSRIVCQNELERNYHVFYELLSGLNNNEKEKYGLQSSDKYFYLNQGHCLELTNKDDGEDFRSLLASMQVLGFNYEEQDTIFRILASILHLGNIYFHRKVLAVRSGKLAANEHHQNYGAEQPAGVAGSSAAAGVEGVEIGSDTEVRWLSHLLQIQFELVMRCLTVRTTETTSLSSSSSSVRTNINYTADNPINKSTDCIVTPLNIDQALDTRDAIARALYTCLFKWLVQRINVMINAQEADEEDQHIAETSEPHISQQQVQHNSTTIIPGDTSNNSTLINNKEPIYLCRTSESLCEFQPDKLRSSSKSRDSRNTKYPFRSSFQKHGHQSTSLSNNNNQLKAATISILDAFGFENLSENNFEQLCVNYAAELLNYHTNRYLVKLEQAEYSRERLRWQPIESLNNLFNNNSNNSHNLNLNNGNSFTTTGSVNSNTTTTNSHSNQKTSSIVNLISKKPLGILALLDDECNFPKATDQSFAEKCHHNHALNENYQCARLAANSQEFGIRHFKHTNRMVWYQVDGFIEKNRDALRPDVVELLVGSKMTIVADMLRKMHKSSGATIDSTGNYHWSSNKTISRTFDGRYVSMKPRQATVAARFQDTLHNNRVMESLSCSTSVAPGGVCFNPTADINCTNYASRAELVRSSEQTLKAPNSWFIVCLKPNRSRTANVFDVAFVQEQVKSMGLFELLQMRKFGFPVRMRYGEFVRRYKCLVPSKFLNNLTSCQDIQAASRGIQLADKHNYQQQNSNANNKAQGSNNAKNQQQIIKKAIRDVCSSIVEYKLQQTHTSNQLSELSSLKSQYQCGLTKMFLNERLFHLLESWRLKIHLKSIELIQKTFRMWLVRRDFLVKRRACIIIQAQIRSYQARQLFCRQYYLIINLQRRWRQYLAQKRVKLQEARRRALKEQQQQQLQELQQQQKKQSNQFRFRQHPNNNNNNSSAMDNHGNYSRGLLDIPDNLAQLYRLQRQWQPIHDMSNLNEVNLMDLVLKEQRRQAKFKSDCSSVPFVVTTKDIVHDDMQDNQEQKQKQQQVADLIDKLELDEKYSLQNFLLKYYSIEEAPQFGYSRLPITRPFSWTRLMQHKRHLSNRLKLVNLIVNDPSKQPSTLTEEQSIRRRFANIEQKAVAIYKLILRFIDSDQSLSDLENDELNLSEQQKQELLLKKVMKFKLISDYINYLCLTEPLLRDEVFLQLASQCWQNPKAKSNENAWKLLLNCLNSFEPLDCKLIKYLIKYSNDYCCDKYRQLVCLKLFEALQRNKQQKRAGDKKTSEISEIVSRQRRYPTSIMEYWANQQAISRLALSASCYMDDHSLIGPPPTVTSSTLNNSATNAQDEDNLEDLNTINYSNKTLVQMNSHTTAEGLASQVLKARGIPDKNLVGWSVEIQHEGALSESSSRLRGDDYLLDHFARLELLPELVQLIDDDLEAFECEQLDELSLFNDTTNNNNSENQQPEPSDGFIHDGGDDNLDCCARTGEIGVDLLDQRQQLKTSKQFNRFSSGSQHSWSTTTTTANNPHGRGPITSRDGARHQLLAHRHSAAMSEFELPNSHRSSFSSASAAVHYPQGAPPRGGYHSQNHTPYLMPYNQQQFEPNGNNYADLAAHQRYNHHHEQHPRHLQHNRRSMSMQELQLAASSALNGRYFMMNSQQPSVFDHEGGHEHHHQMLIGGPPSAHYASSYVSCSQTPDCCRPQTRLSGSLRRSDTDQAANNSSLYKRRSATPNSMASPAGGGGGGGGGGGLSSSRNGARRLSSSGYGSQNGSHSGQQQQQQQQQVVYMTGMGQQRLGRAPDRRDSRGPTPRRSASSSSRTPAAAGQPILSDYASGHSDYERIGYGRHGQAHLGPGGQFESSQPSSPSKRPPGYLQNRRLAQERQKQQHLQVQQQQQQLNQRVNQLRQPALSLEQQQQQQQQIPHYAATSSAMSDTSEAPSMASHVRKVKVPQTNGDLDRYLDDLFNPLLDEADLDELSDARSLATSIRGLHQQESSLLEQMSNPLALSKMIRGTTDGNEQQQQQQQQQQQALPSRSEQLSPTFESLLKSLRAPTLSGDQAMAGGADATSGDVEAKTLDNMNLNELKALNERLEDQIQAAQSARPSLVEMIGNPTGTVHSQPPVPPPQPSFEPLAGPFPGASSSQTADDVYSRAKTIRIGKWRWPPAREQAADAATAPVGGQSEQPEEMALPSGERKRASLLEMAQAREEDADVREKVDDQQQEQLQSPTMAIKTTEQQQQQQTEGTQVNNEPNSATSANVGRLKISSMMKAKLEQLTNNSTSTTSNSQVSQAKSAPIRIHEPSANSSPSSSSSVEPKPNRLAEQRKNLLEHQLLGVANKSSNEDNQLHQLEKEASSSKRISDTPSVSKVLAAKQQLAAAAGVALAALDSTSGASSQASSRRQSSIYPNGLATDDAVPKAIQQQQQSFQRTANSSRQVQLDELGPQTRSAISQRRAFYRISASSDRLDQLAEGGLRADAGGPTDQHGGSEVELRRTSDEPTEGDDVVGANGSKSTRNNLIRATPMASDLNEAGQSSPDEAHNDDIGDNHLKRRGDKQNQRSLAMERLCGKSAVFKGVCQKKQTSRGGKTTNDSKPALSPMSNMSSSSSSTTNEHQWVSSCSPIEPNLPAISRTKLAPNVMELTASNKQVKPQVDGPRPVGQQQLHDSRPLTTLTHANVDWQVRIRKEVFQPSETYDDPLVVQLIFAQLVADVFNPRHWTRLNNKERAAMKSVMKDNSIGYAPSLPRIGEMQSIKRDLVRMARSFGLYFTRSYQALNFACLLDDLGLDDVDGLPLNSNSSDDDQSSQYSSSVSSQEEDDTDDQVSRSKGIRQALRLAHRLRASGNLGQDWLDMVAVHHSGLRLVALVSEPVAASSPPAAPANSLLVAVGPPTPPVGYKVLETLKFRDMTGITLISERVLLVGMRKEARQKSWLISSQQANQLVSLLKSFLDDYNQQVRSSAAAAAAAATATTTTGNSNETQKQWQQEKVSAPNQQDQPIPQQQSKSNKKHQQARKDALLASNDGHDGDHLEQRQTSDSIEQLHSPAHPNHVLADSGRVLPQHLSAAPPEVPPNKPPGKHPTRSSGTATPPPPELSSRQPTAAASTPSNQSHPARRKPSSSASSSLSGGGGGASHTTGQSRGGGQPGGGGGAREHDHSGGGGGPHDSGGDGRESPTTTATAAALVDQQQTKTRPDSGGQVKQDSSNNSKKNKTAKWQNSLSKMSNRFNIFASNSSKRSQPKKTSTAADTTTTTAADQQAAAAVQLDAWIETQVDFDEDDTSDEHEQDGSNNNNIEVKPAEERQQLEGIEKAAGEQNISQQQQQQQKDDGKYSMLQFALYHFREAIEKYSLESRVSKYQTGGGGTMNSQRSSSTANTADQQLEVGDTSTLRGSLKLIESLRTTSSHSSSAHHHREQQPANHQVAPTNSSVHKSGGNKSNEWTWRELAEMVKFTQRPIKRSLLKLANDDLDRRAVECFAAIMQYMGDLPLANSQQQHQQQQQHPNKNGLAGAEVECVYLILINCHNYPKLRDEIYCQLTKQTTNNRSSANADSCLRGWRLFSVVAAYFDCSPNFRPYLLKYLEQAAYDKRRAYHSMASVCLQNLRKTFKYKGRKNVPSIEEIAATSAGRSSKRQIYRLPGGTERVINTKSTTVVDDIIHEICSNMLGVHEPDEMLEYSLYCIADGDLYTMPLNRDEYILDITTELIKNHQQYFLIFCRSIWHYPLRLDSKLYIEVIFNQIAPDYLEGLLLVLPSDTSSSGPAGPTTGTTTRGRPMSHTSGRSSVTNLSNQDPYRDYYSGQTATRQPLRLRRRLVKEIARIAALLHRASGTDYIPHKDEIKYLLPKPIVSAIKHQQRHQQSTHDAPTVISSASSVSSGSQSRLLSQNSNSKADEEDPHKQQEHSDTVVAPSPQKWVELVQEQCREMSAFEALDAKAQFLDIVRHWPLFGSSFFAIKLIQRDLIQPMDFILALNKLGIQMLDLQTHETIHRYPFNEVISTRKVRSEDGALFLDLKCGNLMKRTIIRIQTDQAHEISRLIRQYIDIEMLQTSKQHTNNNNNNNNNNNINIQQKM